MSIIFHSVSIIWELNIERKGQNMNNKQGWRYGKGLIYLMANILAKKISLLQGQRYTGGKCYNGSKNWNLKIHNWEMIN